MGELLGFPLEKSGSITWNRKNCNGNKRKTFKAQGKCKTASRASNYILVVFLRFIVVKFSR